MIGSILVSFSVIHVDPEQILGGYAVSVAFSSTFPIVVPCECASLLEWNETRRVRGTNTRTTVLDRLAISRVSDLPLGDQC